MTIQAITDWQFWASLSASRLPLGLVLDPKKLAARSSGKEVSDSAYVFRMFDLFFPLRNQAVVQRLTDEEREDFAAFTAAYNTMPWKPLDTHPHVSELIGADLRELMPLAQKLDRRLWLRTSRSLVPAIYRFWKGWRIVEPPFIKEKLGQP